jgi:DNA-binding transcriptional regulator GbsR (MarR family)
MLTTEKTEERSTRLSPLELEVIELFVQLSRALNQPRSVAEIYGLLFVSPAPLAMDHLTDRLQLSKGSASQGLRFLRDLGAIRMVYVAGERRAHYEAVAELRYLASHFLRMQILPYLAEGEARLERLSKSVDGVPTETRDHLMRRLDLLKSWSRNSRRVFPLILRVLGGTEPN